MKRASLARGPGPERKTPLKASTELARGNGLTRTSPLPRAHHAQEPRQRPHKSAQDAGSAIPTAVRRAVHDRDGGCVRCGTDRAVQVHHRLPRGQGGRRGAHRLSALVVLCAHHHLEWAEVERDEARALGFLVPHGVAPDAWPIRYRDGWHLLNDDGTRIPTEAAA